MRKWLVLMGVVSAFLIGTWATEKPGANDIAQNPPAPQQIPAVPRVEVVNFPDLTRVRGTVGIDNLPAVQPVSGTVSVSNFPAIQTVTGQVEVTNLCNAPEFAILQVDAHPTECGFVNSRCWFSDPIDTVGWSEITVHAVLLQESTGATSAVVATISQRMFPTDPFGPGGKIINGTQAQGSSFLQVDNSVLHYSVYLKR